MSDLRFYNVDAGQAKGYRRLLVVPRRILRRILRPIFDRQIDLFRELYHRLYVSELAVEESIRYQDGMREALRHDLTGNLRDLAHALNRRQEDLDAKLQTLMALGWDHVAMARRLAALEDQIATLTGSTQTFSDESDPHPSILFPGLTPVRSDERDESENCSKVG